MKLTVMAKEAIIMVQAIFGIGTGKKLTYFKCPENKIVFIKCINKKKCHQIKYVRSRPNTIYS